MSRPSVEDEPLPTSLELMRIVPLGQAAKLAGISERTIRDCHADKIIRISPGRVGMRVRDALFLGEHQEQKDP